MCAEMRLHNPLSEKNIELIRDFEKQLFAESISTGRVEKYVRTLRTIAESFDKDFDQVTKKDVEDYVYRIERSDYSPWTKHDYKVVLKRFYKWLRKTGDEYPEEVKWVKTTMKAKDEILPEDLLTEDEIMKMINACDSPRDRAFIITLYESGARIGELGTLRVGDVVFEESYSRLILKGKTGSRRVIVVASTPYLATWIQHHPLKNDVDAPLWVNLGTVNRHDAMSYPGLAKLLRVAAVKAKLNKKIHPHKLRHSRATYLASKLTEAQMNQVFGWKQGSDMPSVYVHMSGRDTDDAMLGVYGLKKVEHEQSKMTPKICPRCQVSNVVDSKFCSKCGLALDVKAAAEIEDARSKADGIMDELMKDSEFRELLQRKMKQLRMM